MVRLHAADAESRLGHMLSSKNRQNEAKVQDEAGRGGKGKSALVMD
jgi:hypothetical protein